ncbi:MAG: tripartite tricarboxylate transporter family receptor [Hyphomicrobiales bacterium]|nr:tripartite tricarboxylate transporter family receptor [Hyphomicrobiales bacterium]
MRRTLQAIIIGALLATSPGMAQETTPFFAGKTLRILVGYENGGTADADPRVMARHVGPLVPGPGNAFDAYARLLAQHFGRHIPGTPAVVVQNMPGAGGLRATTYLAREAAKDGLTLAMPAPGNVTEPLLNPAKARYDPRQFAWIGSLNREVGVCAVWSPEIRTLEDLRTRRTILGGTGPAASSTLEARALARLLGFKFDIVLGYPNLLDIRHPAERGEVDGFCGLLVSSIGPSARADLAAGKFRILLQTGLHPHRELGDLVPQALDLAPDAQSRDILSLIFGPWDFGKALAAPPGTPAERVETLRRAFAAVIEDPDFLGAAARGGIEINAMDDRDIVRLIDTFYALPATTLERARSILAPPD